MQASFEEQNSSGSQCIVANQLAVLEQLQAIAKNSAALVEWSRVNFDVVKPAVEQSQRVMGDLRKDFDELNSIVILIKQAEAELTRLEEASRQG